MIFMRRRVAFLAPASALLLSLIVAAVASAYPHPLPGGGKTISSAVVPAFKPCTIAGSNGTHGAPLAFPSCSPPVVSSDNLIVRTQGSASLLIRVYCHAAPRDPASSSPAPADNGGAPPCGTPTDTSWEDVKLSGTGHDVRCRTPVAATKCAVANAAGTQPDYTGQVVGISDIRITDANNTGVGTDATVVYPGGGDVPFAAGTACVSTPDTAIGSNCNFNTTANTIVPDVVVEGKQAVVQTGQVQIWDGGADGIEAGNPLPGAIAACPPSCFPDTDSDLFATQGIYIP